MKEIYREVPTSKGDPWSLPLGATLSSLTGLWAPRSPPAPPSQQPESTLGAPCGPQGCSPLGHHVVFPAGHAAAAVEALILQDGLVQRSNAAPVSEQQGFHDSAGTEDMGKGTQVPLCTLSWAHDLW